MFAKIRKKVLLLNSCLKEFVIVSASPWHVYCKVSNSRQELTFWIKLPRCQVHFLISVKILSSLNSLVILRFSEKVFQIPIRLEWRSLKFWSVDRLRNSRYRWIKTFLRVVGVAIVSRPEWPFFSPIRKVCHPKTKEFSWFSCDNRWLSKKSTIIMPVLAFDSALNRLWCRREWYQHYGCISPVKCRIFPANWFVIFDI